VYTKIEIFHLGDTIMYDIYCLTFKTTGKKYIGFTGIGVMNRLHKHYINAGYGTDSHLYRAIRLYGIEDILIDTLYSSEDKVEALKKEEYYIELHNTVKDGYNETGGGVGGWCVPEHKLLSWKKALQKKAKGFSNPNAKQISNEEIIDKAISFYINNGNKLTRNAWGVYCKNNHLPRQYTQFRFGGGYHNFILALKKELNNRGIFYDENSFTLNYEERYKEEYNKKISKTLKEKNVKNKTLDK
jgi:hypothetical protein